jgi:hypothetical protein
VLERELQLLKLKLEVIPMIDIGMRIKEVRMGRDLILAAIGQKNQPKQNCNQQLRNGYPHANGSLPM